MPERSGVKRERGGLHNAVGEFLYIVVRLWPLYLAGAVLGFVLPLIGGDGLSQAARTAALIVTFAVWVGPLGWVAYNESGAGLRHVLRLMLVALGWLVLLFAPALWLVSWADP